MMARSINTRRLAAMLANSVLMPEQNCHRDQLEEGIVDAAAITRVVTSPHDRHVFFQTDIGATPRSISTECTFHI